MFLKVNYHLTDKEAIKMGQRIRDKVKNIDMTEDSPLEKAKREHPPKLTPINQDFANFKL